MSTLRTDNFKIRIFVAFRRRNAYPAANVTDFVDGYYLEFVPRSFVVLNIIYIFGIALALSMDAFAVSVVQGVTAKNLRFGRAFVIAFSFGVFQAIMPVIGWSLGPLLKGYIESISHWVAFILLAIVGGKMIYESIFGKKDDQHKESDLNIIRLLTLSIATSIDALAVGLTFSLIGMNIFLPAVVIGSVTFVVCFIGVYIGNKLGYLSEKKLGIAGGVVLILIGIRILVSNVI